MRDTIQASLRVDRQPSTLHTLDADACRAALLDKLETAIVVASGIPPRLLYVLQGHLDSVPIPPGLLDPERDAFLAATFRQVGDRPGVLRRFRIGEVVLPIDGTSRRCAALLEHLPSSDAPNRWWVATRPFGEGALGAGTLHGDWSTSQGDALDALDEPFRSWLDPRTATVEQATTTELPPPQSSLRMAVGEVPAGTPLPSNAHEVAAAIGATTDSEFSRSLPSQITAYLLAGRTWERWDLESTTGPAADEVIRALAVRAQADSIAVIRPMAVELNGAHHKGWAVIAEKDGDQVYRVQVATPGPDGGAVISGPYYQRMPDFALNWLGVAPVGEVELTELLGVVDRFGNPVEPAEA